jgi:hypothetical protein
MRTWTRETEFTAEHKASSADPTNFDETSADRPEALVAFFRHQIERAVELCDLVLVVDQFAL